MVAAWRRGWIIEWEPKFPHVSLLVGWSGGGAPGEILKTKNAGEAISGHFAMRLKSQIYLNYAYLQIFQRRKSSFIPCFLNVFEAGRASSVGCAYRLVSRRSRVRSALPAHSFVEICMVMKNILRPLSPFRWFKKGSCQLLVKECALSTGKLPGSFFWFWEIRNKWLV